MNLFNLGETVKINLQLDDGVTSKYPRAYVYQNGTLETTIDLTHIAQGRYGANWAPLLPTLYSVVYVVFKDGSHTQIDPDYSREMDIWRAIDPFIDANWDEPLTSHTIPGSTGDALNKATQSRERVVQGYAYVANQNKLIGNLWYEKDGQLIIAVTSCTVSFYTDQGVLLFSLNDLAPDAQGVFQVSKPSPGFTGDMLIYAVANVLIPGPRNIVTVKAISIVS